MTKILLTMIFSLIFLISCEKNETTLNRTSTGGNTPVLLNSNDGGNVTCDFAAANAGLTYQYTTGRVNYTNGSFSSNFGIINVTTDGVYVNWTITPPTGYCVQNMAVIVKGGRGANVYYYNNGETSDSGLASPVNASGKEAGLSNLTFCYNLVPCQTCNWQEETAFGGGVSGSGNAWWFALDASTSGTYPIYAGQNPISGAFVTYDAVTDQITINLGSNMQLQNVSEPVKVEGYNNLPSSRPPAGLFTLYKGTNLTVQGNNSNYYIIHLDVEVCN
jgi:hypothetical protein